MRKINYNIQKIKHMGATIKLILHESSLLIIELNK